MTTKSYTQKASDILNRLKSATNIESDADLCRVLNINSNTIANWKSRGNFNEKPILAFCEEKSLDLNWIFFGKEAKAGNMESKKPTIPLIPIDAMAGIGKGDYSVLINEAERYTIPDFNSRADFLIRISGSSMAPIYNNGDLVACKKIPTETFIQWGKVYILDTIQGALCKKVVPSKKERHIICRSENQDVYPDFEISWDEIRSLAIVVGTIRLE